MILKKIATIKMNQMKVMVLKFCNKNACISKYALVHILVKLQAFDILGSN